MFKNQENLSFPFDLTLALTWGWFYLCSLTSPRDLQSLEWDEEVAVGWICSLWGPPCWDSARVGATLRLQERRFCLFSSPCKVLGKFLQHKSSEKKDLVSWEALKTPPLQRVTAWGWGGAFPGVCPPSHPSRCACCWGKEDRPGQQPQTLSPVPLHQPWTSRRGLCAASSYLEEIYKPLSTERTLRGLLQTIDQPRLSAL